MFQYFPEDNKARRIINYASHLDLCVIVFKTEFSQKYYIVFIFIY